MNIGMWVSVAIALAAAAVFFVGMASNTPGGVGTGGLGGLLGGAFLLIIAAVLFLVSWLI